MEEKIIKNIYILFHLVPAIILSQTGNNHPPVAGFGSALLFDGHNDYVQLSSPLTIGNISSTITVRVKVPEVGSNGLGQWDEVGVILGNYPDSINSNWSINSNGNIHIKWNDGEIDLIGVTDLRDNIWHHLAFSRDLLTGQFYAYIDGENEPLTVHTSAGENLNFSTAHRIGADNRSNPDNFHGLMDELQIWNRSILPSMINDSLVQQFFYAIPPSITPELMGNWHMDVGMDSLVLDATVFGNNGIMINMDDSSWVNSLPVSFIKNEDETFLAYLPAYDIDLELLMFNIESQPEHGHIQLVNAVTGAFRYYPEQHFNGNLDFTWKVSDQSFAASDIQTSTISLTPVNDAPVAGFSTAISFNGENDYIQLSSELDFGSSSSTLSTWVKVPEVGSGGLLEGEDVGVLFGNYPNDPNAGWFINENGKIRLLWNNGQLNLTGSTDLRDNTWHHLSLIRDLDENKFYVYIDGERETITGHETAGDNLTFTSMHRIGSDHNPNSNYFHGTIDEMQLWNGVHIPLATEDSLTKHTSYRMPSFDLSELIATWHMDSGRDSIVVDVSNNQHNGILFNVDDSLSWVTNDLAVDYVLNEDFTLQAYLPGNDIDGDMITFSIEIPPDHGMIEIDQQATGQFLYQPALNYNGIVQFSWKVSDGSQSSSTVTSNISVLAVDDVPIAENMDITINENSELADTLFGFDVDQDTLVYSIIVDALYGSLVLNDSLNGAFTYLPEQDYVGEDEFTYTVYDGHSSDTATVALHILEFNYPPAAINTYFTAERNILYEGMLLGSDPDDLNAVVYNILTPPSYGTLELSAGTNRSLEFSGAGNVFCGNSLQYESMTIAFWAEPNENGKSYITRGSSQATPSQRNWDIYSSGNSINFSVSDGTDEHIINAPHPNIGDWHYIVASFDATRDSMKLYVNNNIVGLLGDVDIDLANNKSLFIGGSLNHKFIGRMDEVRIFDRSLSDEEIDQLYNGSHVQNGLITYYRMNSSSEDTLYDHSENGIDGVVSSSSWSNLTPVRDFTYMATTNFSTVDSFLYAISDGEKQDTARVRINIDLMGNNAPVAGYGTGLLFDGIDDYVSLGEVVNNGSYSKIAWVKRSIGHSNNHIFSGSGNDHALWVPVDHDFKLSAAHNGSWDTPHVQDTETMEVDQWYHVAVTFELDSADVGTMKLFKDGVLVDESRNVPLHHDSTNCFLGTLTGSDYFNGLMDEVSVWNQALSEDEISEYMYRSIPIDNQGLVGYWHMDEGSGVIILDATGNSNDGYMNHMNDLSSWISSNIAIYHDTQEDNEIMRYLPLYDMDNDPLSYTLVTVPEHGTVTFPDNTAGAFVYTPYQDYYGEDVFAWNASDGLETTQDILISLFIEAVPDPPTANNMLLSLEQNATYTDTLLGFDVDGDIVYFGIVSDPINGSLSLLDTSYGVFTYTPPEDYIGSDMFTFLVSDSDQFDTANVHIAVGMDSSITAQFESSHSEVEEEDVTVSVNVILSGANLFDIYIPYTISNLSSADNQSDFIASNGQLTIAAGELETQIDIQILDDEIYELAEEVVIMLGNSNNAIVTGNTSHFLKINDNDYPANWDVNPSDFEYFMTVIGKIEGSSGISDADFLGAFQGDQCRGLVTPVSLNDDYYFPLMIYSNESAEFNISFRYYAANEDVFYSIQETVNFFSNSELGSYSDPLLFTLNGLNNQTAEFIPQDYALYPAYPNPFNPVTTIRYDIPKNEYVFLKIYDMMGREVRTLHSGYQTAGNKSVQWDGRNNLQEGVSAGVYLYMIHTSGYTKTRKLILLK